MLWLHSGVVFDREFFLTLHAVRRQLAAMPNEFYVIRLIHGRTRRPCPGERMWDVGQLLRGSVLRFLRARNLQGFDVYVLPFAEYRNAGYILLDLNHSTADGNGMAGRTRTGGGSDRALILTTTPNVVTSQIHNCMPVILTKDDDLWLDPGMTNVEAMSGLLRPFDACLMRAYPVSVRINQVQNDDADCSKPVALEGLPQSQLCG